jgi:uncharacterized 2Fe-2S/4Fe-4S cluster protein (DUF4445 family)
MDNCVSIKKNEIREGETLLATLVRMGFPLSAPCGGRGLCGKCRVTLIEGSVRLTDENKEIKNGEFCACRGEALTDITLRVNTDQSSDLASAFFVQLLPDRKINRAGVGLDIGTTTIAAQLVCLDTGDILETVSALNSQKSFGADVMSRINAAQNGKKNEMFSAINSQIKKILNNYIFTWDIPVIEKCTVSGNTAMLHLFTDSDPSSLGTAPYTPLFLEEKHVTGKDISLPVQDITLLPGISAFVGADITAGLAFIDITKKNSSLFIDIGTNGEMALWNSGEKRLYCCSTAAGPCFEGAEISCGMYAGAGAVNKISLKKETDSDIWRCFGGHYYTTLKNTEKPRGICGAGLIDAIAVMKKTGAIDETGTLAENIMERGFPIAENIFITQKDVRQFQLAKSAIYSGIKILCKEAALEFEKIDTLYIAGGLGFFINLENAALTGLFPKELTGKAAACGNTSLNGAVKSLTDVDFLRRCEEIVSLTKTVDLANNSAFSEAFMENMII